MAASGPFRRRTSIGGERLRVRLNNDFGRTPPEAGDVRVALQAAGASITDGFAATVDANRRWPDVLAERLQARPQHRGPSAWPRSRRVPTTSSPANAR